MRYLSLLIRVTGKHLKSFCCALSDRLIAKWHLNRSQLYDSASKAREVLPTKICTAQNALELFWCSSKNLTECHWYAAPQKIPSLMAVADRFTWRYRSKPRWILIASSTDNISALDNEPICVLRQDLSAAIICSTIALLLWHLRSQQPHLDTLALCYWSEERRLLERGSCLLRHCSRSLPDMSCGFHCQQQDQIQSTTSHLCRHCSVIFLTLYCLTHVIKKLFFCNSGMIFNPTSMKRVNSLIRYNKQER